MAMKIERARWLVVQDQLTGDPTLIGARGALQHVHNVLRPSGSAPCPGATEVEDDGSELAAAYNLVLRVDNPRGERAEEALSLRAFVKLMKTYQELRAEYVHSGWHDEGVMEQERWLLMELAGIDKVISIAERAIAGDELDSLSLPSWTWDAWETACDEFQGEPTWTVMENP